MAFFSAFIPQIYTQHVSSDYQNSTTIFGIKHVRSEGPLVGS